MGLLIGILTLILVVNSAILALLILIQLPKKEAGAGLAFGGGASDALFGAGSGNVITRVTKYAAGVFLALSLALAVMRTHTAKVVRSGIVSELERQANATAVTPTPGTARTNATFSNLPRVITNTTPAIPMPAASNTTATSTNAPAPSTNAPRPVPGPPGK